MVGGFASMVISGKILDRTRAFLTSLRAVSVSLTLLICIAPWVIPSGSVVIACSWVFLIGVFMFPAFPICIAFSVRLTHPVPCDVANGLMMSTSYIFSSVWGLVGATIFNYSFMIGISCFIFFSLVATIAAFLTNAGLVFKGILLYTQSSE